MRILRKNEMTVTLSIMVFVILMGVIACADSSSNGRQISGKMTGSKDSLPEDQHYKVTFIELGSVRCIPCQQMHAVMKSIETKYGKEVKIDFHDVWTETSKPYGVKYGIEAIPTQVFLDGSGKEYYRHVGYFPEEELVKVLQMKGVKVN